MDSNPRSPVAGRGQAARNQIFRRTTGAEAALETVIPDAGGLRVRAGESVSAATSL
jgi:hypothetical protein